MANTNANVINKLDAIVDHIVEMQNTLNDFTHRFESIESKLNELSIKQTKTRTKNASSIEDGLLNKVGTIPPIHAKTIQSKTKLEFKEDVQLFLSTYSIGEGVYDVIVQENPDDIDAQFKSIYNQHKEQINKIYRANNTKSEENTESTLDIQASNVNGSAEEHETSESVNKNDEQTDSTSEISTEQVPKTNKTVKKIKYVKKMKKTVTKTVDNSNTQNADDNSSSNDVSNNETVENEKVNKLVKKTAKISKVNKTLDDSTLTKTSKSTKSNKKTKGSKKSSKVTQRENEFDIPDEDISNVMQAAEELNAEAEDFPDE
ncbi:MAG: hypothetical protein KIT69_06230 [Propionibacteriaceae bacterium]|nr:hypothetical protein [Propionibacteriaceae bacterium]